MLVLALPKGVDPYELANHTATVTDDEQIVIGDFKFSRRPMPVHMLRFDSNDKYLQHVLDSAFSLTSADIEAPDDVAGGAITHLPSNRSTDWISEYLGINQERQGKAEQMNSDASDDTHLHQDRKEKKEKHEKHSKHGKRVRKVKE